ncbi:MAG TPA: hypothetical protein VM099_05505 [Gemmatimonadaceae bacterium]|nr:hypothetical protein [Gemmatimonadaceae bacterium]
MTQPASGFTRARQNFFDRRFAPLIAVWIVAAVLVGLIYWFERAMPAFDVVVKPVYALIVLLAIIFTARWVRTRGKGNRRNHPDRRRTDRRNTSEFPAKPPET